MSEKCYSTNGEDKWVDEKSDLMDTLLEDHSAGDVVVIYIGDSTPYTHDDFINADSILDDMSDHASNEIGEWQDDYLDDCANDKEKIAALDKLLLDFFNENVKPPTCFRVGNIKKLKIIVEG